MAMMMVGTVSVQTSLFTSVCVMRSKFSSAVSSCFTRFHTPNREAGKAGLEALSLSFPENMHSLIEGDDVYTESAMWTEVCTHEKALVLNELPWHAHMDADGGRYATHACLLSAGRCPLIHLRRSATVSAIEQTNLSILL